MIYIDMEVIIAIILALTLGFHIFTHYDRNRVRLDHSANIKGRDIWVYITNQSKIDIVIENIAFFPDSVWFNEEDRLPDYTFEYKPDLPIRLKPSGRWQEHYAVAVKFVEKCQDIRFCQVKLTNGKQFSCKIEIIPE